MNYKDSISIFKSRFETEQFNRKVPLKDLTNRQIMFEMSYIQTYLQNVYKLYTKSYSLTTVIGQSLYTTGTNAYNIPTDILDIKNVRVLNGDVYDNLKPVSKEQMNVLNKSSELTSYSVYGSASSMIFEIDYTPTVAGTIYLIYYPRLEMFDSFAGTTYSNTFSDTNYIETTLLGEWLLPEEWHILIIDGALANYFPDKKEQWYRDCRNMRPIQTIDLILPNHLGVDNG